MFKKRLMNPMIIEYTYHILVLTIALGLPISAILNAKKLEQKLKENPAGKTKFYQQTLGFLLVLTALILAALFLIKDNISNLGISFITNMYWPWLIIIFNLIWLWIANKINIKDTQIEKLKTDYKDILFLMPASNREYKWTIALSFAAGIFEEIIYRGFLFWQLNQFMPLALAVIVTNVIFGLCHYGTKLKNAVQASILGVLWSISYIMTGSLWLAMLTHISIDIYAVTVAKKLNNRVNSLSKSF